MNGFVCLNKDGGMTSFAACSKVRAITNSRKAGHTGTLDPMATGVLPVALGGAVRFIGLLAPRFKTYDARFITGKRTDTLDITGKATGESGKTASLEDILEILPRFKGEIRQVPPMFSAIKKDGVRLYELARRGEETEREPKTVTVGEISVSKEDSGEFALRISCSAGTYIRSIIGDIGDMLGCGAVMTSLTRTSSNGFHLSECKTLKELEALKEIGALSLALVPTDRALCAYPKVTVTAAQSVRFGHGGELFSDRLDLDTPEGLYRVYSPEDVFLGVGNVCRETGVMTVKRIYNEL